MKNPTKTKGKLKMFILGLDTGKNNIGLALYNTKTQKFKTLFIDKGKNLKLKNNRDQTPILKEIHNEISSFIKRNTKGKGIEVLICERFMITGKLRGMVGEIGNIVIGMVISIAKPKEIYMITASSWKRKIKPKYNSHFLTVHEQDAEGVITYYLSKMRKN